MMYDPFTIGLYVRPGVNGFRPELLSGVAKITYMHIWEYPYLWGFFAKNTGRATGRTSRYAVVPRGAQ